MRFIEKRVVYVGAVVVLLGLLAFQIGWAGIIRPPVEGGHHVAGTGSFSFVTPSWTLSAANLGQARAYSRTVLVGQVVSKKAAPSLRLDMPGDPTKANLIPREVVTFKLLRSFKGAPPKYVKVIHYRSTTPNPPADDVDDAKQGTKPKEVANGPKSYLIEGDPPFKVGERHLLFLVPTKVLDKTLFRTFSPEGRYRITKTGKLASVTKTGVARSLNGKTYSYFKSTFAEMDTDKDGVLDKVDKCVMVKDPKNSVPSWGVGKDDPDCDGFPNRVDFFVGKRPFQACAKTPAPNDEKRDGWPADINDDQRVDTADAEALGPAMGSRMTGDLDETQDARYSSRFDLNADGFINGADLASVERFMGRKCVPGGPPPAPDSN